MGISKVRDLSVIELTVERNASLLTELFGFLGAALYPTLLESFIGWMPLACIEATLNVGSQLATLV